MRFFALVLAVALGACAAANEVVGNVTGGEAPANPFPVERGSALPPPAMSGAGQTAPPEGVASGGIDFGRWRGADPASYAPAFQSQLRQRYAGQTASQIRANLEANGFACTAAADRTECRIEIMERQCAHDWYAVLERGRAEPVAGFDIMCLGAR
jgi:hypothetical protein